MDDEQEQANVAVEFCTRSRQIFYRIGGRYATMQRPSVAIAWRIPPEKEWRTMNRCPVPEEPGSGWSLLSKKWENVELKDIPA